MGHLLKAETPMEIIIDKHNEIRKNRYTSTL